MTAAMIIWMAIVTLGAILATFAWLDKLRKER